jgi:hypothetical protein
LAEESLELLDPVDDRQHDSTGALAGEPCRAQRGNLVVKPAAQILLYPGRRAVGDHRAMMIDDPAQEYRDGDAKCRNCHREQPGVLEHSRQQHAEDRKSGDPDHRCGETQKNRRGNPAAHTTGQLPQAAVKIHRGPRLRDEAECRDHIEKWSGGHTLSAPVIVPRKHIAPIRLART